MGRHIYKKNAFILIVGLLVLSLAACGIGGSSDEKTIRVGTSPGPYSELFISAIKPILEKEGYTVKLTNFSDLLQADIALSEGNIDLNVDQHTAYLTNFNVEKQANLTPIVHIPTVRAGIFSNKHNTIDQVQDGAKVAIPQDPSNAGRAYLLLQKAGWIKLKPGVTPLTATQKDIISNPKHLNITTMDSAQIPRAMDDIDFGILPGSIVYASHIDPKKSLLSESLIKDLELVATVDKKNINTKWAKAVVEAYKSEDFKKYLAEHNKNDYWYVPSDLK
ncbi:MULTISPECIES: MetQ/NlpA family ABC transporter substrate-binding protein [Bacillus]|uniref:Metal ABC transporter substrate-binding protein n=2 Tax=Bacillus TaxID=1386 RepID=A0A0M4FVF3_9BACI|nr:MULTISPECIES: MetQ/NlpA family ABC transporter substrate-binding protein [Bacillus]ALC82555.1 metal ABC transporter substrate-binding protein [Bacillus gobiensis]MBP1081470.1 D-methionine transport system substrate-binding protein [Bacillus capparidis]MED1096138.1 MetQ/NlpA family ABC transporter substrate-binding protein [Bacillus capparidis]